MPFNLIGHQWAIDLLQRHYAQNRLRHAYLFTGPAGVGKRTLVGEFARLLLCSAEAKPCGLSPATGGHCRHCQLVAKGSHPDLFTIAPILSGKRVRAEKIKIEPVRQLIYDLTLKPVEAQRRVARLLSFDAANAETMNALLKTLEEPPENVVLLLTAESQDALLPTIVSRCEVIQLRPLPLATVQEALITHWLVSAEQAKLLAHLSGGRLGWAVRMAQESELLEERGQKLNDVQMLLAAPRLTRFQYVEKLARETSLDRVQATLEIWQSFWRDVLLAGARADAPLTNLDYASHIQQLAEKVPLEAVRATLAATRRTSELLERNVNARLALENLLLDWPRV